MSYIYIYEHIETSLSNIHTHSERGNTRVHTQYIHRYSIQIPVLLGERVCIYIECAQESASDRLSYTVFMCAFCLFGENKQMRWSFVGGLQLLFFGI